MTALPGNPDRRPARRALRLRASGLALACALGAGPVSAESYFWTDPAPSQADTLGPSGLESGGVVLTPDMSGGFAPPAGAGPGPAAGSGEPAAPTARRLWKTSVRPYASTQVTVTDNVGLDPRGEERSDTVLTGTVGLRATVEGTRAKGSLNYAAHYDHYFEDSQDDGLRHDLAGALSATVVPGLLYLDVAGSAAESFARGEGKYSLNPVAGRDDRERVYFGSVSPALRRNLGGWANAELRYTHARSFYEDGDEADEWMHGFSGALVSDPRRFQKFGWGLSAAHMIYDDELDDKRRASTVGGSVEVPVSPKLALMGAAGYDHVRGTSLDEDQVGGGYVNVGARFVPSRRLNMDAYLGWRNQGLDYGANLRYALAERLGISASAGRSVEFLDFGGAPYALLDAGTDDSGNPLYRSAEGGLTSNRAEALAVSLADGSLRLASDPAFSRQTQDAVVDSATLALSGSTGKTGVSLVGAAQRRDYGGPLDDDEWTLTLAGAVNRDLTSRVGVDASAAFILYAPDDPRLAKEQTLSFGVGASYRITEIVNAFARYTYTRRFSDSSLDEYQENAGVLGLRADF